MRSPVPDCLQLLTKKEHPLRPSCDNIAANRGAYGPNEWARVKPPQGPSSKISSKISSEVLPGSTVEPNPRRIAQNPECPAHDAFCIVRSRWFGAARFGADQRERCPHHAARGGEREGGSPEAGSCLPKPGDAHTCIEGRGGSGARAGDN